MQERIKIKRVNTSFDSRNYSFSVITLEIDNNGEVLLEQSIFLLECSNPNEEEKKAIDKKTPLYTHSRVWLNNVEKEDYSELVHSQLEQAVKNFPANYLHRVRKIPYE